MDNNEIADNCDIIDIPVDIPDKFENIQDSVH